MFGIFNVSTDVNRLNAYNKRRGCTNTVRESELKADCSQKNLSSTSEVNLHQQHTGPEAQPTPARLTPFTESVEHG